MTNDTTVADMQAEEPTTATEPVAEQEEAATTTVAEGQADGAAAADEATDVTNDGVAPDIEPVKSDAEIIEELRTELAAAETRSAELLDQLQRTAAEFQNSRRRQEKQVTDAIERASSPIIQRLLPVIDDLELAFGNLPADLDETNAAWVSGFRQIHKKVESLLEDQGVTAIAPDGPFDPNRHEAVSSEPNEETESGHIIQTLRTGYEYKGRVLRPALVRVAM
ncbi:MAG: nucleotide exchange factor GrpE [Caldilineaceae bacterium]